jgi:hypothetical protein
MTDRTRIRNNRGREEEGRCTLFRIIFALCANLRVESVSEKDDAAEETAAMIVVLLRR